MSALTQAVQDAIAKDLPGFAAGELKKFIEGAERTEQELTRTKSALDADRNEIAKLRSKLDAHVEIDARQRSLEALTKKLTEQELALLKREAELVAKIATAELNGVKDTMAQFLRNPVVRTTVVTDATKAIDGTPPGAGQQYGHPGFLARNGDGRPDTTTTTAVSE